MVLFAPAAHAVPVAPADITAGFGSGAERERIATGIDLASGTVPSGEPGDGGDRFGSLLTVDLTEDTGVVHMDGGSLTSPATVPEMAAAAEPPEGSTVVAAFNGGYFDLGATQAPSGAGMRDGRALTSPDEGFTDAVVIDADGTGTVREVGFDGTVTLPSGDLALDALNTATVPADGLALYTSDWGEHPREHVVHEPEIPPEEEVFGEGEAGTPEPAPSDAPPSDDVAEAVVSDGTVDRVTEIPGSGPIAEHEQVLVARGSAAASLAALAEGDPVGVEHTLTAGDGDPGTVLGGRHVLVRDGEPVPVDDDSRAPRTAVGFSADGRAMHAVTTDGRNASTDGTTLAEAAELLAAAGADRALELDGGGSSTLVAREPGGTGPVQRNRPGGEPREVPDGLLVTAPEGSGRTSGLRVHTALEPRPEHGSPAPPQADPRRVFTGMHRTLAATGHDEAFGPSGPGAPDTPDDRTGDLVLSAPTGHGDGNRYVAGDPGPVTVTGEAGPAIPDAADPDDTLRDTVDLEVLPGPDSIHASPQRLGLASADDTASFVLTGATADGDTAPVEPLDAEVDADPDLVEVSGHGDGRFEVRARTGEGSGTLTVTAGGASTEVPFSVGSTTTPVADLADAEGWTARSTRGEAEVETVEGRDGPALALDYDFTRDIRTRDAALHPPEPIVLDRQAFTFTAGVRGDGNGARLVLALTDDHGVAHPLQGPEVDWEGWRDVRFEVPDNAGHPLTLDRVYLVEEDPSRTYTGGVVLDGVHAGTVPEPPTEPDPAT
ncbi:phosphodiester glycosidase family protein [Nocardiopsis sp. HNM0947]|uniref:Phosphodiester glycosidase family protein n=1 Tax=Nocardiopsis coralli TaxID=2772213 RepID=A0ABR9PAE0_9ACTN|nr:phosphodiester glycosidase family protein [Nocardiopsis coralli]